MTVKRKLTALSVLPVMLAAGQGLAAAAPGQPGLAVPGEGQPGLSEAPAAPAEPAAPSLADYIPDPPVAPPNRPRPSQQTTPDTNTWVQPRVTQPETNDGGSEPAVEEPQAPPNDGQAVMPTDPHQLRVGYGTVQLPDFVDTKSRDKAQAYLDMAEWQIAAMYDSFGFSREDSDRMAATGFLGAGLGLAAGGVATVALVPLGCAGGAVVGAIAGGLIGGIPTAGVMAPAGALIGGVTGCLTGAAVVGIPAVGIVGTLAALAGQALSGGDATKPQPTIPASLEISAAAPVSDAAPQGGTPALPLANVSAPVAEIAAPVIEAAAPIIEAAAPIVEQAQTVVEQVYEQAAPLVEQVNTVVEQAVETVETQVDSFRAAVSNMPPLDPAAFLAGLQPAPPVG
ncbi:hypothetical protein H0264_29100 [Nocardia huaxiensis]|uniref:Insoluble domain protein n=1 Tax=Nocardia huaxiensis TaxID=2755382 RepID=A0A7D6ZMJ1_9NOCA|nr:hypothetical protein [Nocardia huaxiensis]QLY29305.1 hypothetical protein H0264_29100 [Nocardia huaxiensis]